MWATSETTEDGGRRSTRKRKRCKDDKKEAGELEEVKRKNIQIENES